MNSISKRIDPAQTGRMMLPRGYTGCPTNSTKGVSKGFESRVVKDVGGAPLINQYSPNVHISDLNFDHEGVLVWKLQSIQISLGKQDREGVFGLLVFPLRWLTHCEHLHALFYLR